jgi:hypothetical protein
LRTFERGAHFRARIFNALDALGKKDALEQSLAQEETQIQQDIESRWWAKFYPVFSLGFKLRF